jgi:hypothetical protein
MASTAIEIHRSESALLFQVFLLSIVLASGIQLAWMTWNSAASTVLREQPL